MSESIYVDQSNLLSEAFVCLSFLFLSNFTGWLFAEKIEEKGINADM
jgi:hypothetical protein